jgi:CheY-like chemotaxis protein
MQHDCRLFDGKQGVGRPSQAMKDTALLSGLTRRDLAVVLIADPVERSRTLHVESVLFFSNYRVVEATDGLETVEKIRRHKPRVAVLSLSLPKLDSWEAIRAIKLDPATRDVCIIGLAEDEDPYDPIRARDLGVDLLVQQPCLPAELLEHVRACMATNGTRRPTRPGRR